MMRQHESKFLVALIGAVALAGMSSTAALAGLVDNFEALQQAKSPVHQYRFEGGDAASRQSDNGSAGVALIAAAGEGGAGTIDPDGTPDSGDEIMYDYPAGDVNSIGFEPGYSMSQAFRPQSVPAPSTNGGENLAQRRSGAAFYIPTFTNTPLMTIEAIVSPDAYVDGLGNPHYILQTRPGSGRGYYMLQQAPAGTRGTDGAIATLMGSAFPAAGDRPKLIPDYSDADPRHWYYVAATFDMSGGDGAPAVVNSWYADLSAETPTLVQSNDEHAFGATLGTGLLNATGLAGVGMFVRPGDTVLGQEFFYGAIDNLTIYDTKLSAGDVASHFTALVVPEPASLALLTICGLALGCVRRR